MNPGNEENSKSERDSTIARLRMLSGRNRAQDVPPSEPPSTSSKVAKPDTTPGASSSRASGVDPPRSSRSVPPARKSEPLPSSNSAARSTPSRSTSGVDTDWGAMAHRTFVASINAKINELVVACRNLERERLEIESMRSDLQEAVDAAESRIAEAEAFQGQERILELENRLLESNEENIRLSDALLTARAEFDALIDYVEEQEQLAEQENERATGPTELEQSLQIELEQLRGQLDFLRSELQTERELPRHSDEEVETLQGQITTLNSQIDSLGAELKKVSDELKRERERPRYSDEEVDAWKMQIGSLEDQVKNLNGELKKFQEESKRAGDDYKKVCEDLKKTTDELKKVHEELKRERELPRRSEQEVDGLKNEIQDLKEQLAYLNHELREERARPHTDEGEVKALQQQIESLKDELKRARELPEGAHFADDDLQDEIEQLHRDLTRARADAMDFRMQAEELSAKIARMKGPNHSERSQAMTWEERKQALLEQLEAEAAEADESHSDQLLNIEKVIRETSEELNKKDAEILELRNLLEQQSISQDGLAIGAAAIASAIDNDSLVIAERMKLKELQTEWEQKQRQFEIEMSLERAKVARERLELQEKMRDLENAKPEVEEEISGETPQARAARRKGKWLSRLGLKEE